MIGDAVDYMYHYPVPGCIVEFGVWRGDGLKSIADCVESRLGGGIPMFAFDSFEGMPPTEVNLEDDQKEAWKPGGYSDTSVELVQQKVPGATIIKGVFSSLRPLAEYGIERVRLARLDCDIYEGYRDALRLLTPHVGKGTLFLFDEGFAVEDPRYHNSIRESGVRAIHEWQEREDINLHILKIDNTEMMAVIP